MALGRGCVMLRWRGSRADPALATAVGHSEGIYMYRFWVAAAVRLQAAAQTAGCETHLVGESSVCLSL